MTYRNSSALLIVLVIFLFSAQALATHEASEPTDGKVGSFRWLENPQPVSEVQISDGAGKRLSLSDFKGKVVLPNLWASWCPPCIRELPALDRLQQRIGDEDFVVVAVSMDSETELARQVFVDRLSIKHLKLYTEPAEQLGKVFPVDVLPASFFINRDGQAMSVLRSYVDWDDPQADELILRLTAGVEAAALKTEKTQRDQEQAK
ncbi:MAG: TlpA disulfide reductase family protein [Amphritea sp.]